jgi:hypothetical protein
MPGDAETSDTDIADLATVIGFNARRFRRNAGVTLDEVSRAARRYGLSWSESRVADFEAGRVAPDLRTLIPISLALVEAGCVGATWDKLLTSVPPIRISNTLLMWDDELRKLLSGHIVTVKHPENTRDDSDDHNVLTPEEWLIGRKFPLDADDPMILMRVHKSAGATEERIRRSLGIPSILLSRATASLWKRTFSQERDRRAGAGANAQKRGQVTRQMRTELQAAIGAATSGDDQ